MDKRKNNGGHSTKGKAGRPSNKEELKLAESIFQIEEEDEKDKVLRGLYSLATKDKNMKAIELWLAYKYGKPNQSIDHTTNGNNIELPPLNFIDE